MSQVRPGVVVVGSLNVDYVISVERHPRPGETVLDAQVEFHGGGKGANQASAAALCGARVDMVGRVGDDPMGASRRQELAALGVGTTHVLTTPGTATGLAFITVTRDGENEIIVASGANAKLCPADVDSAAGSFSAGSVLVAQLEVPVAAVARAAEIAGPSVWMVLNCAPFRPLPAELMARTDILVANEGEASELAGRPITAPEDVMAAAGPLLALGPRVVIVTLGPRGAVVVGPALAEHVAAPAARVVDTTGAGDAFVGALAARLSSAGRGVTRSDGPLPGRVLLEAVHGAVAVGSATTEQFGATAVVPPSFVKGTEVGS